LRDFWAWPDMANKWEDLTPQQQSYWLGRGIGKDQWPYRSQPTPSQWRSNITRAGPGTRRTSYVPNVRHPQNSNPDLQDAVFRKLAKIRGGYANWDAPVVKQGLADKTDDQLTTMWEMSDSELAGDLQNLSAMLKGYKITNPAHKPYLARMYQQYGHLYYH
jgi:hypothetical protein